MKSTLDNTKKRIERLQQTIRSEKLDGAAFFNFGEQKDPNMRYYADLTLGFGCLVVPAEGSSFLIAPEMEIDKSIAAKGVKIIKLTAGKRLTLLLKKQLKGRKKIAINEDICTLKLINNLRKADFIVKEFSSGMTKKRIIKDEEEIRRIRAACKRGDEILTTIQQQIKQCSTEAELAALITYEIKKKGCELAFEPIVASGKNTAYVHHRSGNDPLQKGFLLLDFGVKYEGYCSDMTRMLYIGKPSKEEIAAYEHVLHIQQECIGMVKEGISGSMLDDHARKMLGKRFIHSLGHGVGVEIHEAPSIGHGAVEKLQKNMVITIEPGIYLPNKYGIRIEDTVVVGGKVLTKSTKELITFHNVY
ncbi:M24 family metallopeptidase [Candidatus Woesearchaeota archaeon]|nr:M24 family metallopeptidase [Candidatus Woesearchaeota archaeon]